MTNISRFRMLSLSIFVLAAGCDDGGVGTDTEVDTEDSRADSAALSIGTYVLGDAEEQGDLNELHLSPSVDGRRAYDRSTQCGDCARIERDQGTYKLSRSTVSGHRFLRLLDEQGNQVAKYQYTLRPGQDTGITFKDLATGDRSFMDLFDLDRVQEGGSCGGAPAAASRCARGSTCSVGSSEPNATGICMRDAPLAQGRVCVLTFQCDAGLVCQSNVNPNGSPAPATCATQR